MHLLEQHHAIVAASRKTAERLRVATYEVQTQVALTRRNIEDALKAVRQCGDWGGWQQMRATKIEDDGAPSNAPEQCENSAL